MKAKIVLATLAVVLLLLISFFALQFMLLREMHYEPAPPAGYAQPAAASAAARLAQAIRFQTVSHTQSELVKPEEFLGFQRFLESAYPRAHEALSVLKVNDFALLFCWEGQSDAAPVILMGHYDVVPAEATGWSHPPFAGVIQDGYIWGRGVLDDKSGVLGLLEAVEALLASGFQPQRTIYLAFGFDEEVGGDRGARAIAARLASEGVRASFVLDEGGQVVHGALPSLLRPVALVGVAEKGRAVYRLSANGAPGHSSAPRHPTAIGKLAGAVSELTTNQPPVCLEGVTRDTFRTLAPHLPHAFRFMMANDWLFGSFLARQLEVDPTLSPFLRTTVAPVFIKADGRAANIIPGNAEALVDFRLAPGESLAKLDARLRDVVEPFEVSATRLPGAIEPSSVSRSDNMAFEAIARSITTVFPDAVVTPGLLTANTDSVHFLSIADDVYRFSPHTLYSEDLTRIHGVNERMAVKYYMNAIEFYVTLISNL